MSEKNMVVGTSNGLAGYFAVLYDKQTMEPWQTGVGRYKTRLGAALEAKVWAETGGYPLDSQTRSVIDSAKKSEN
jgi:hypothetical protein